MRASYNCQRVEFATGCHLDNIAAWNAEDQLVYPEYKGHKGATAQSINETLRRQKDLLELTFLYFEKNEIEPTPKDLSDKYTERINQSPFSFIPENTCKEYMENEPLLIDRKEAARLLSVTPSTITNMAARGIIHSICRDKKYYYPYEEIKILGTFPETHSATNLHESISQMEAEMKQKYNLTEQDYQNQKKRFIAFHGGEQNWYRFKEIALALLDAIAPAVKLSDREKEVLNALLELKPLEEIEKELGIKAMMVDNYFRRGIRRVMYYYPNIRYLIEEKRRIATENDSLRKKIESLENTLNELTAKLNLSELEKLNIFSDKKDLFEKYDRIREIKSQPPFNIPIEECGISVRLYSVLKWIDDLNTLGDFAELTEEEFRKKMKKVRNWGPKSTNEVVAILEKYGLKFGMIKYDPVVGQ